MTWKIIARHKWVSDATITESIGGDHQTRYTATICGFRNWRIWTGDLRTLGMYATVDLVIAKVKGLRDRILADDESVFNDVKQAW